MDVQVGDVIQTKKPHPCGANRFDVPVSYTHLTLPASSVSRYCARQRRCASARESR